MSVIVTVLTTTRSKKNTHTKFTRAPLIEASQSLPSKLQGFFPAPTPDPHIFATVTKYK